jgi:hypothetical protein
LISPESEMAARIDSRALWLRSPALKPPLRVGLLLDDANLPRFSARIVEDLLACNFVKLELLVYKKSQPSRPQNIVKRIVQRLFNPTLRKHSAYDLYLRFDRRRKDGNHPLDRVDCSGVLAGIDSIEVEPFGEKFVHRFPPEALEQIRGRNLDVLIRFGFNILKGEILTSARCGVWSYHHGDNDFYRGGPPHFWELYEGSPRSGVILQMLTEELDAGTVLCKSLFTTKPTVWVSLNRFRPYWGTSDLVVRKLNGLHQFGWERVLQDSIPPAPYQGRRKIYRTPTNAEMARWLVPALLKKGIGRPFTRKTVQHWRIGIRLNTVPLFDSTSDGSLGGFRWIEPPKGHFWADPFVLEQGGRKWAFFEDYVYAKKRGHIACAEITSDGNLINPTPCIEDSHHYSYPYVFRDGEELLMIPEAAYTGSVDLFRCVEFPQKWAWQSTLLRGEFVDSSVWYHGGLWWMMTTSIDPDAGPTSLFLFYAEKLSGRWHFHPANPASTDVRTNRGAGRIFQAGARLIRPSQNCSPVYGYSFSLNEVTRLSTTEYAERTLAEFRPEALKVRAVHTYNWIPGVEVIDGAKATPLTKV